LVSRLKSDPPGYFSSRALRLEFGDEHVGQAHTLERDGEVHPASEVARPEDVVVAADRFGNSMVEVAVGRAIGSASFVLATS